MSSNRTPVATTFGSYGYAWQQYKKHFLYLFLIGIIVGVANAPTGAIFGEAGRAAAEPLWQLLAAAYGLLILPVFKFGADLLNLKYMRDESADIGEIFGGFKTNYVNIVLAHLLVVAIVGIGIMFLIVPGIVFACRLAFVPYLVMDKGLEPVAAVEKSWDMTRGRALSVFGVFLVAIPLCFAGLLLLGVGIVFALIWVGAAMASLYHAVDIEDEKRLDENGAAPV